MNLYGYTLADYLWNSDDEGFYVKGIYPDGIELRSFHLDNSNVYLGYVFESKVFAGKMFEITEMSFDKQIIWLEEVHKL